MKTLNSENLNCCSAMAIAVLLCVTGTGIATAQATSATQSRETMASQPSSQTDTAAILEASQARTQAMIDKDMTLLDALLADDFTVTHISGYQQPKSEWLDQITSGQMTYHGVEVVSASVEINDDIGVLTTRNLVDATIYGAHRVWPLASVTTYQKLDGL